MSERRKRRKKGNSQYSEYRQGNSYQEEDEDDDDEKDQHRQGSGNDWREGARWEAASDVYNKSWERYRKAQQPADDPTKMAYQRMVTAADMASIAAGIKFEAGLKNFMTPQDPYGGMVNAMWMAGGMDKVFKGRYKGRIMADEVPHVRAGQGKKGAKGRMEEELATKTPVNTRRKTPEEEPTMDLAQMNEEEMNEEEKNGKDITEKDPFNPWKVARTFKYHETKLTALNTKIRTSITENGEISQSLMKQSLDYITSFYADCASLPVYHPLRDARCKQVMESFEGRDFDQDFITDTLGGYAKQAVSGF